MYLIYKVADAALRVLGFSDLRPAQIAPIQSVLRGGDTFVCLPTAGGKSAIFQIPAIMDRLKRRRALSLVVSPLRALQLDQVSRLKRQGIDAEYLNSDLSKEERKRVLHRLPDLTLVYLAPEQLLKHEVAEALAKCRLRRVVIDEVHVLPQTELSFRQAYGKIGDFIASLPHRPQVIALTATATPSEQAIAIHSLGMIDPDIYRFPMRRENLRLHVKRIDANVKGHKKTALQQRLFCAVEQELKRWGGKDGACIIFCPTVNRVIELASFLKKRGKWKPLIYHGKMNDKDRKSVQESFVSGENNLIIATNAFGLGVDKADVRLLIHAGLPLTMSGYIQEVGRSGRDGKKARCVLFFSDNDYAVNKNLLRKSKSAEDVRRSLDDAETLWDLLHSKICLWQGIEAAYGYEPGKRCKSCSHCNH